MQIPHEKLDEDILFELLKEIVTRDGTDYGIEEKTTEQKINSAMTALKTGKAILFWDPETETASLEKADHGFK